MFNVLFPMLLGMASFSAIYCGILILLAKYHNLRLPLVDEHREGH